MKQVLATIGHFFLFYQSASYWRPAMKMIILKQQVDRGTARQVTLHLHKIVIHHFQMLLSLVLSCPEKGVSCVPSCDTSNVKTMDNVTSQRQCASMEKYA